MKHIPFIKCSWLMAGILLLFIYSCKKEKDYRDAFVGSYVCDYVKEQQHYIEYPDSIFVYYDYTYDYDVVLNVTKSENPEKVIILGHEIVLNEDGTLESIYTTYSGITGAFYPNDSIHFTYGEGKLDGYVETWDGKK